MKALLELHLIQNFAPSNLNRDDTGSPKDAYFGGTRRARVSSQSFKRAMRMDFKNREILNSEEIGERTKRAHEAIRDLLVAAGKENDAADKAAFNAVDAIIKTSVTKNKKGEEEKKSSYLVFLGRDELQKMADVILSHWDAFEKQITEQDAEKDKKKPRPVELDKTIAKSLEGALNGKRAVDIALFGRMLADLPERNTDAAAQVAHALGTHALKQREFDFYTAVDDLKPNDNAGADMLGTVEFGSATFYRYIAIDLAKLRENLDDDALLLRGLEALLYATVYAAPTGKQNTFAAHNLPSLISAVVRQNASPRNLANAFEVAVKPSENGYVGQSIRKLDEEWAKQDRIFGQGGKGRYVNAHSDAELKALGQAQGSVDELIKGVLDDVRGVLGLGG